MSIKNQFSKSNCLNFIIHLLISLLCVLVLSVILLCLFAKLICTVDIPLYLSVPFATISVCISVLVAAMLFAALRGEKGLIYGFILGIFVFIILCIIAIAKGDSSFTGLATLKFIALCCSGAIGGYMGISLKVKAKHKY
ncbi:MAG: TIGR04086 family membrane protein [Oscillospiraceae bacterium]